MAVLAALLLAAPAVRAQEETGTPSPSFRQRSGHFTYGGAVGMGFGGTSWGISLRGEAGYLVTTRLWTGVSGRLQWSHGDWQGESQDSVDYGVGAYARFFVLDRLFATAEWDWTSYELESSSGSLRNSFSSFLVGGGYGQPAGGRSLFLVELLYDVTGNLRGVYDTPWVTRISFATGF